MVETYREEQEANIGEESVAHRFIKGLEDAIDAPNAFGSEELDNDPRDEDDSWEQDEEPFDQNEEDSHEL